jgi:phytanoyl-CoA hydroxylase
VGQPAPAGAGVFGSAEHSGVPGRREEAAVVQTTQRPSVLTPEQVAFFEENGYLRVPQVFGPEEVAELSDELDYIIQNFAGVGKGWSGPWRQKYLKQEEDERATLAAMHELELFSPAFARAILNRRLAGAVADLIGPEVEFHHMTLHAKGPEYGTPFPLHQDHPFYPHSDGRYIDAIIHIDAATEENGCLKFLPGSHRLGPLPHVTVGSPHLPPEQYPFEQAVSCPAEAGDVVLFSIWTIHGSALNRTPHWRRVVRVGYRNPRNLQVGGQAMGRPGIMVAGLRPKIEGVTIDPYGPMKVDPARLGAAG